MLKHAIESFEHGLQHFLEDTEISRKFALLHVDHAIELMIKEKIVQQGMSIYKGEGKTIGFFEALGKFDETRVPERPRIEELRDFRNTVQHKGLTPDYYTTEFYVREAYQFIERFMKDKLGIEIEEYVPKTYIQLMEGTKTLALPVDSRIKDMLLNAEKLFSIGNYEVAVVSGFIALESVLREITDETGRRTTTMRSLVEFTQQSGLLNSRDHAEFRNIRAIRNEAVHGIGKISKEAARQALDNVSDLITKITPKRGVK